MREGLETDVVSIPSTTSGIINHYRPIRKCLESHFSSNHYWGLETQLCSKPWYSLAFQPAATTSSSIKNISDIPDEFIPLHYKVFGTGYALWCGYHYYIRIKGWTFVAGSLYKYIKKIITCMVLTEKKRLKTDIKPETLEQIERI